MPIDMPEDSPDEIEKKWRYRKPGESPAKPAAESVEEPREDSADEPKRDSSEQATTELIEAPTEGVAEEKVSEGPSQEAEVPKEEAEGVDEVAQLREEITSLNEEIQQAKRKNQETSKQVADLLNQVEESTTKKDSLSEKISDLTVQLDQANIDKAKHQTQITELKAELEKTTKSEKKKSKNLTKTQKALGEAEEKITKLEENNKRVEKKAKEREEHLLTQLEAMAEQIGKLRGVIKKRDDELVALQKDILVKKDLAQDAQEQASQLRTVGIVQREAVQDTTVLRRRVNDLEVEYEQLKKALQKDPKYRIYLLVRETGQRTLEELSKILGVGVFEVRRRVQELVRASLLELKDETVKLARRMK